MSKDGAIIKGKSVSHEITKDFDDATQYTFTNLGIRGWIKFYHLATAQSGTAGCTL